MSAFEHISHDLRQNQKCWLVTGAAGFIGSNLCLKLLELNQKVIGLDNYITSKRHNIDELNRRYGNSENWQFVEGDICQTEPLNKILPTVNYVLHQAAVGSVPRSLKEPMVSHLNNVSGFLNLIELAKNCSVKKVVYASSSSVYGDNPALPKVETLVGEPLSPYAATKKMNEIYAQVYHRCYQLPIVGLRYFNVFGPRQDPSGPYAAVIPLWIESLLKNQPVYINGDGTYSRDFCYVDNVVQANILAATSDNQSNGKLYNIAFGGRTDLNQLYSFIQSALHEKMSCFKLRAPNYREIRSGDIPHSHADISMARTDLKYDPKISAADGLKTTVDYFLEKFKKEI